MEVIFVESQLNIARLQNKLWHMYCDAGDKCLNDRDYLSVLDELYYAQSKLRKEETEKKGYCGYFWWNLPWEKTLERLITNFQLEEVSGKWHTEIDFKTNNAEDNTSLYLTEEGHFSNFVLNSDDTDVKVSPYSDSERQAKVSKLRDKYLNHESYNILATAGHAVYAERTGEIYDSASDYYSSPEYRWRKYRDIEYYERSLYKNVNITTTVAKSNSADYASNIRYCYYSVDENGQLDDLFITPFTVVSVSGQYTEFAGQGLLNKSEKILAAYQLSIADWVKTIPVQSFAGILGGEFSDYNEAINDSAALTCIADKFEGDFVVITPPSFQSQEHFQELQSLLVAIEQNGGGTESELKRALDVVNKDYFKADQQNKLQMKCMLSRFLIIAAEDNDEALFHALTGEEMAVSGMKKFGESVLLLESAIAFQTVLSEYYLNESQKFLAAKYAEKAIENCGKLRRMLPNGAVLSLEKQCEKIYKRATKKGWLF